MPRDGRQANDADLTNDMSSQLIDAVSLAASRGTAATQIDFFVPGLPRPGGSKRAFINPKTKRPIVTEDNSRSKDWRASVAQVASAAMERPLEGALAITFVFCMPRPRGHYGKRGLLPSAPAHPTTRPDVLKLARSTEDALTGIAYRDDAQIVHETLIKAYGDPIGCRVAIRALSEFRAQLYEKSERIEQIRKCLIAKHHQHLALALIGYVMKTVDREPSGR